MDVNVLLFPNFETLDVFGPAEIFGSINEFSLHFLSLNGDIIKSKQGAEILTKSINGADWKGVLLIPGGQGTRVLVNDSNFIEMLKQVATQSIYCLAVCTGSALLAKTGLLDGRKATSNKKAFDWVKSTNTNVDWVSNARWVVDGKFYTSSGVSAGMDMSLGFIADILGKEIAFDIANFIEYVWNPDRKKDIFAR